jgi:HlyD family secretion protein
MKKLVVIMLIAGVVGAGVYYWRHRQAGAAADAPELITARVERGQIESSVSTTGRVVPNLEVEIKCKASGEVTRLPYDVSDSVEKGELLIELDPVDERRLVKQAEESLSASQARLAQARQSLLIAENNLATEKRRAEATLKSAEARAHDALAKSERMRQLFDEELASQEAYDSAETAAVQAASDLENARIRIEELKTEELALELRRQDVRLAEAQVESDKVSLLIAQQRLKDTKVVAPIDGVVSSRNVQIGQIISSGISNVGGGTTVLTLADLSRLFVLASVDESDIGNVRVGQPARITTDAFPGETFSGEVVRIATKGVNTSNVVTFEAKVEVLGRNKSMLKPEMTATLRIIGARKDDTLYVPIEAIYATGDQRVALVVEKAGNKEERPVEVGISDGVNLEILSGLSEGDTVVVHKGKADSRWRNSPQGQSAGGQRMMIRGMRKHP